MAQGKMKKKMSVPQLKKKQHRGVKKQSMKRHAHAGQYIAPKKAKLVVSEKLKKNLERAIKTNIEEEISSRALSIEPKKFHLVKLSQQTTGRLEKNKSKKKK